MDRKAPDPRPWPIIRSASAGLGYEDPVRIRRWPMSDRVRPAARTEVVYGELFVNKSAPVRSS